MKGAVIRNVRVTKYAGKLLNIDNVTGTGLNGAAKLDETNRPKAVEPIAAAETPYKLH